MHSNLSPYLIDVIQADARRAASRRGPAHARRRRRFSLRLPRGGGRRAGRVAPA